jgi:hypothetical protein
VNCFSPGSKGYSKRRLVPIPTLFVRLYRARRIMAVSKGRCSRELEPFDPLMEPRRYARKIRTKALRSSKLKRILMLDEPRVKNRGVESTSSVKTLII